MITMSNLPPLDPGVRDQFLKDAAEIDRKIAQEQARAEAQKNEAAYQQQQEQQVAAAEQQIQPPHQEQVPETSQEAMDEKSQQYNFTMLREAKEAAEREKLRIERERDDLIRRIRENELQQKIQQLQSQINTPLDKEVEPETQIAQLEPDALAEGKHVSQLHKENREMRTQLKQYQKQTQQQLIELQLKTQYPDFDAVVSQANVEELKRAHPSIAQALAAALQNDPYNAASSTYTIIKQMGIDKVSQDASQTRRMIQENASKPRSAQAASPQRGSTPLSQANEYMYDTSGRATPEYQEQLRREMEESRRRLR